MQRDRALLATRSGAVGELDASKVDRGKVEVQLVAPRAQRWVRCGCA